MTLAGATLGFLLSLSAEFGGEKLIEVKYTDGSSSSIEAGRGLLFSGGALLHGEAGSSLENYELQGTLGTKWTSVKEAKNGGLSWSRFPVEALGFWHNPAHTWRVGGGMTAHFANKFSGEGIAADLSTDVENAYGVVLEGDYFFPGTPDWALGLRYTRISYQAKGGGPTVDGSSAGVALTGFWF